MRFRFFFESAKHYSFRLLTCALRFYQLLSRLLFDYLQKWVGASFFSTQKNYSVRLKQVWTPVGSEVSEKLEGRINMIMGSAVELILKNGIIHRKKIYFCLPL